MSSILMLSCVRRVLSSSSCCTSTRSSMLFSTAAAPSADVTSPSSTSGKSSSSLLVKSFDEMPGPKGLPLIGNVWRYLPVIGKYRADRLDMTGLMLYHEFGPIVREHVFRDLNVVHLFDPNDMEAMFRMEGRYPERRSHRALGRYRIDRPETYSSGGIFCENGKEWQRLRRISQQAILNPNNVNSFIPETEDVTQELINLIRVERNSQLEMSDFQYDLYKWSLENITRITLDTRLGCLRPNLPKDSDARKLIRAAHEVIEAVMKTEVGQTDLWRYYPTRVYKQLVRGEDAMSQIVSDHLTRKIQEHKLFQMNPTLESVKNKTNKRKEEDDMTIQSNFNEFSVMSSFFQDNNTNFGDVLGTVLDLMLAGIDTTAFSAGFVIYYLAKNPDKQEILRREVMKFFKSDDSKSQITPDILNQMPYLKACVKETLRLTPLSIGVGRVTTQDVTIRNYSIPTGTMIITQNQVACRFSRYFDSPNDFRPERWMGLRADRKSSVSSPTPAAKVHPFLSLPFGYGPRSCPGRRISDMNTYILMIKLLLNFRIEYHHEDIGVVTRLINIPDAPMKFRFVDINN